MAETGAFGLIALALVCLQLARLFWNGRRQISSPTWQRAYLFLIVGASSAFIYQLFNTEYWSGKMWLPIGIALASISALKDGAGE